MSLLISVGCGDNRGKRFWIQAGPTYESTIYFYL